MRRAFFPLRSSTPQDVLQACAAGGSNMSAAARSLLNCKQPYWDIEAGVRPQDVRADRGGERFRWVRAMRWCRCTIHGAISLDR